MKKNKEQLIGRANGSRRQNPATKGNNGSIYLKSTKESEEFQSKQLARAVLVSGSAGMTQDHFFKPGSGSPWKFSEQNKDGGSQTGANAGEDKSSL